jgi:uncharacterized protein
MKIGVLSDTHKKVHRAKEIIDHLLQNGTEFLIHAGDIVEPDVLKMLKNTKCDYVAVYGNNDAHLIDYHKQFNLMQEPYYFRLSGVKLKVMHLPFYLTPDADVVIFGHTHTFECDYKNKTLFLNPGEACARNKGIMECAILEITNEAFDVTYYHKEVDAPLFDSLHYSFEREIK